MKNDSDNKTGWSWVKYPSTDALLRDACHCCAVQFSRTCLDCVCLAGTRGQHALHAQANSRVLTIASKVQNGIVLLRFPRNFGIVQKCSDWIQRSQKPYSGLTWPLQIRVFGMDDTLHGR